jgi:3-dehydroshikimate dehydratase
MRFSRTLRRWCTTVVRMLQSGLVSVTLRKSTPSEIFSLAKQCGLRGIEWGGDVHVPPGDCGHAVEVRELTEGAGLSVAAYGSYYRAGQSEAAGLPFGQVLDTAVALGAPVIRVWAGTAGSDATSDDVRWRIIEELRRIADLSSRSLVGVSLEFHGGTLTDTNESASQLLVELDHPNIWCQWQPHNGEATDDCLDGLRSILPCLGNIHVFHWWPTPAERLPLADGIERWRRFFDVILAAPGPRYAMLEFVPGDEPTAVARDAATLNRWLDGVWD